MVTLVLLALDFACCLVPGAWCPMGMTAVATLTATSASVGWLRTPGHLLLWIAVSAWTVVLVGMLRGVASAERGQGTARRLPP